MTMATSEKEEVVRAQDEKNEPKESSLQSPSKVVIKSILKSFVAHTQSEGAGFIVNRPIGYSRHLSDKEADPFLMLDELGPKYYNKGEFEGAPWHPHRGFDTVMYLKEGYGTHQDSMGNKGTLGPGDCQWMTAGKGIIHDEGRNHPGGMLHGFQLWVNLPKEKKMCDPKYQTITSKNFRSVEVRKSINVKAIAGSVVSETTSDKSAVTSPIKPIQPINYFDYSLEPNSGPYVHKIPQWEELTTVIVYVYNGKGHFVDGKNDTTETDKKWVAVERKRTLYFGPGECIEFKSTDKDKLEFLLLVGKPLKEPIARRGGFVMNTEKEILKAFEDYKAGKLATIKGEELIF